MENSELAEAIDHLNSRRAKKAHLEFMRYCWRGMQSFIPGFHTSKICELIDSAIADFRNGKTTYLLINVHPRSGKSDIVSRYLGPHFLGEFPESEVMQVSFAADKAIEFSAFARGVIDLDRYKACYPDLKLSTDTNRKDHYLTSKGGGLMATGLQGHLTGSGFALGILDDYCSGRAEAESKVQRDNAWEAFTNDFLTRIAPAGIVIVLATQWHEDDITGRIKRAMLEDDNFPRFKVLTFPARAKDYTGEGKYSGEFLFEERYPKQWYLSQYAQLGKYSSAALMDCNPMLRTGGRFSLETIQWLDVDKWEAETGKHKLYFIRVWDLAHTAKQRAGDDPDWTAGTKLAFERRAGDPVPYLWVEDVSRNREEAPDRDAKIKTIAHMEGARIRQCVESSLDAKDAYPYLKKAMPEITWNKIIMGKGDKATRAVPLEAIFEAPGHVICKRGSWNDAWIDELMRFDGLEKEHDDQVDNLSAGYQFIIAKGAIRAGSAAGALGL
jgi:predicted phage terminase large subunit-like protein